MWSKAQYIAYFTQKMFSIFTLLNRFSTTINLVFNQNKNVKFSLYYKQNVYFTN